MSKAPMHLLFSYPGSKWGLAPQYAQLFPPHKTFVDVFGGTGALLARKSASDVEVFNDLDADVINVFRVIQSRQYHKLVRLIQGTHNTQQQYERCRAILDDPSESPVRKAWSFITCGYIGLNIHPCITRNYDNSLKGTSRLKNCPAYLAEWRKRLKNVVVANEPWQEIIEKHDSENTVFVCDPPYMPGVLCTLSKKYYQHNFTTDDHVELLETIQQVKGRVVVCGYNHPAYLRRLWHWRQESFPVKKALTGKRSARQEQVWLNYDAKGNRVIGNRIWITKQFLALAGWGDCDDALILIDLLKEITQLAKGAVCPDKGKTRNRSPWLNYTENGTTFLDNRLWIGKKFVEAVGGFDEARRMLETACSEWAA